MTRRQTTRGIFERPKRSGVWWISYMFGKQRHREKVGRRDDALEAYMRRRREIREGKFVPRQASALSFRDLAAAAMEHKRLRLAPASYATDLRRLGHLLPKIGAIEAERFIVDPELLENTIGDLKRGGLSGSTCNRYRALLSSIFSFGFKTSLLRSNPVGRVARFKENPHRVRWLRPHEEAELRKVVRAKYPEREPELDLALYTGMRRGEQFTLKWADVDLENGILTVYGKTGRRHIVVNSATRAAIEKLGAIREPGAVHVRPDRSRSDTRRDWRRWFEDSCKLAGIENFHWHDLRHTFASRLVMAGADLVSVQKLLGHASLSMTQKYAHISPGHLSAAAEKIGGDS
ncbi:MAG TPA: site-specific integrase [Candidatus Acidoferrum sp.]|jgi:site-specific recombinase XerD|nr:site-specific integrase [Candidatus Acidoferrum sp.]